MNELISMGGYAPFIVEFLDVANAFIVDEKGLELVNAVLFG